MHEHPIEIWMMWGYPHDSGKLHMISISLRSRKRHQAFCSSDLHPAALDWAQGPGANSWTRQVFPRDCGAPIVSEIGLCVGSVGFMAEGGCNQLITYRPLLIWLFSHHESSLNNIYTSAQSWDVLSYPSCHNFRPFKADWNWTCCCEIPVNMSTFRVYVHS